MDPVAPGRSRQLAKDTTLNCTNVKDKFSVGVDLLVGRRVLLVGQLTGAVPVGRMFECAWRPPCVEQFFNKGDANGDADGSLLVLQSVARTHLYMRMASLMAHLTRQSRFQRARRARPCRTPSRSRSGECRAPTSAPGCRRCGRSGVFRKDLVLHRQKRAAGIHHVDAGQIVLPRDVLRAQMLLHRHGIISASPSWDNKCRL